MIFSCRKLIGVETQEIPFSNQNLQRIPDFITSSEIASMFDSENIQEKVENRPFCWDHLGYKMLLAFVPIRKAAVLEIY